ncbi:MAG: phosphomannomutase/phosphoglucomutase [Methanophagales archaeon]|nr:phosphomannomutase/phosphoglucomutase [Methanophagales archaeon]
MAIIDRTAYRANDIRGIADENSPDFQLSDEFCTITGLAYVELLRRRRKKEPEELRVVIGKDVRTSSKRIKEAFAEAMVSRGVHVIDIAPKAKVSSTPLMYFATWLFNADGGVEVTGSHLDKEWNGFKLCIGSESTTSDQIDEMYNIAKELEAGVSGAGAGGGGKGEGEIEDVDVLNDYHRMIRANIILRDRWEALALKAIAGKLRLKDAISIAESEIEKMEGQEHRTKPLAGLKVVYDAGNGTTGVIAPPIFRDLGAEVIELYCEPDGNFPHHLPDPTIPRYLDDLHTAVASNKAHIGLASDSDGDRAGAVSPGGRMIIGEQILALLCKHILKEHPNATIVYDTKCSDAIKEIILENGGVPVECKTGFSFIKSKMEAVSAVAGGEMSGHVYFEKNNRADDAVFAFSELLLLTAVEFRLYQDVNIIDKMLEDFLSRYVNTPEIRLPVVNDEEKERVSNIVEQRYRELAAEQPERYRRRTDAKGNDIDGVKIEFLEYDGWALIRRSNTSPVIILRMEARSEEGLRKIEEAVISEFRKFDTVDLEADEYVRGIVRRLDAA